MERTGAPATSPARAHLARVPAAVGVPMLAAPLAAIGEGVSVRAWIAYGGCGALLLVAGLVAGPRAARAGRAPTAREGGALVVVAWLAACLLGAVPLALAEGLDATRAVFESISGWTTTGFSVVDVAAADPATLAYRSWIQFAGGAGFAIMLLATSRGTSGASIAQAEGRGEPLLPHVRSSVRLVLRLYAAEAALGLVALWLAGMSPWHAFHHSLCAVSTGGFSSHPAGVGHWDVPAVEAVLVVLMLLGQANVLTVWCLLRGKAGTVAANGEVRTLAVVLPIGILAFGLAAAVPAFGMTGRAARVAVFEATSALTTTGYSLVTYDAWAVAGLPALVLLMLVGGAACSTAGGLKQQRLHLLVRAVVREVRRPLLPRTAVVHEATWEGDRQVQLTDRRIAAAGAYAMLYLGTWWLGTMVLAASGLPLAVAAFEWASTLGTVGLSTGATGATTADWTLWMQSAGMFLGRLEFLVVLAAAAQAGRLLRRGRRAATLEAR